MWLRSAKIRATEQGEREGGRKQDNLRNLVARVSLGKKWENHALSEIQHQARRISPLSCCHIFLQPLYPLVLPPPPPSPIEFSGCWIWWESERERENTITLKRREETRILFNCFSGFITRLPLPQRTHLHLATSTRKPASQSVSQSNPNNFVSHRENTLESVRIVPSHLRVSLCTLYSVSLSTLSLSFLKVPL